tara:strand:+ start:959 stop:1252 length:294 start_codon:yes stop_codon:yes gene_type:complete
MVTTILSIIFGILTIFFGTLVYYSLKRINRYEEIILQISDKTDFINSQLKVIDDKGTFEADDEVGFFFKELRQLGEILNNLFEEEVENASEEKEEKE